jgi:hypothetical protein
VNEYRAATPGHPWPRIVVDFNDEVVKMVRPSQVVARCIGPAPDRAIVPAVSRILTPGIISANAPNGEQGARRRTAVGSPPQADQTKATARRCAIALALIGLNAGPPERDRNVRDTDSEPALAPVSRARTDKNVSHSYAAHGQL